MPSVRAFMRYRDDDLIVRVWAYLHDPMPVDGPQVLFDQKRVVDGIAASAQHSIDRYVVDSGSALTHQGRGARLEAMIDEARRPGGRILLIVASPRHLAIRPPAVAAALADLLAIGVALKDASGELHPSAATVGLAQEAALRRTRFKSTQRRSRDRADV